MDFWTPRDAGRWRGNSPSHDVAPPTAGRQPYAIARRERPTHVARKHKGGGTSPTGGRAKPGRMRKGEDRG